MNFFLFRGSTEIFTKLKKMTRGKHLKRPWTHTMYALTSSKHTKYTTHDPNQRKITEALVSFIAGSLTPLSVVENPEFKFLIESLNPRYQLPSRKHFSTKLLLERSTSIQNSLKSKLRAVESVCLTIDLWSNR